MIINPCIRLRQRRLFHYMIAQRPVQSLAITFPPIARVLSMKSSQRPKKRLADDEL
jgi:hypothetical protein